MEAEIPDQAWEQIDQLLLNGKLAEIAEGMQRKLAEGKANVPAEGRKRGNAGFYPAARIQMEERIADEWAAWRIRRHLTSGRRKATYRAALSAEQIEYCPA